MFSPASNLRMGQTVILNHSQSNIGVDRKKSEEQRLLDCPKAQTSTVNCESKIKDLEIVVYK